MVQCTLSAVGYHAVDELHIFGMQSQARVTAVQCIAFIFRQAGDLLVVDIVFVQGDDGITPTGSSEIFGEGLDTKRIVRQLGHE